LQQLSKFNFPKFKLRFEVHVTVFDNVNWLLQCCKLKHCIIQSRDVVVTVIPLSKFKLPISKSNHVSEMWKNLYVVT